VEAGENRHSGECIAQNVIEVTEEIGNHKVGAIVSNNAGNVKGIWRIISKTYPHINTLEYAAHGLNLLSGDLCLVPSVTFTLNQKEQSNT
jgi:hypothetical protein